MHIGSVELTIHPMSALQKFDNSTALAGYIVNGKTPDQTLSVPKTVLFVHPSSKVNSRTKGLALRLPPTLGQGYHMLALRPVPNGRDVKDSKFKLLGVTAC